MPKLTDVRIRSLQPKDRLYRVGDGQGLYLEITPSGGKHWRYRYRYGGRPSMISLGPYPEIGLAEARHLVGQYRALLARGIDPAAYKREMTVRQRILAENSFEAVAKEWADKHLADKAPAHAKRVIARLDRFILPYLRDRPIAEVSAPEILAVVRRIEQTGHLETAHRVLQIIGQIMRYAVATGRADFDPTPSLKGAIPPAKTRHMAAPTDDLAKVGEILRMLDGYGGSPVVAAALRLLPYVFVRPGELRQMRWDEVDLEHGEWRFVTSKTKVEHLVPLSRQAVAILKDLYPLTGHLPGGWVFPNGRSPLRPMSEMAINAAYRRLGIDTRQDLTGHGWRAVARTLLHEKLGYPPEVIEHQLAHVPPDPLRKAYNRTKFIEDRRQMMQVWADYLDRLRDGGKVIPFVRQEGKEGGR